ncbi:MAG TPA: TRAP transporter permease [Candidatus Methylomirabilis sp.]|nr:TRAP transporter permease [Candidatus Methylomirabilis sp.]
MRKLGGGLAWLAAAAAVAMSGYHIWAAAFGVPEAIYFRGTHLAFALSLIFLWFPARRPSPATRPTLPGLACLAAGLAAIGYLFVYHDYVVNRYIWVDPLSRGDLFFGILLMLLVLEAARRTLGPALPLTALLFLGYAFAGPVLPGPLQHRGFSLELVVDQLYLSTEGIFGIPLAVSATYVILFVLFGAFLEKSGTGQLFTDFATALTGHTAGGPGKVSCVSSGLFGTISGSAVANVMVDGWLTIPLMKRTGFRPAFAAAVEAVASTGGQIMPPVMGAAAFVMAEFLGMPYITIAKHALIPALLYYLAVFVAIHFEARRTGLRGLPREELPPLWRVLRTRGHLFLPVLIILGVMLAGYTAPYAALWALWGTAVLAAHPALALPLGVLVPVGAWFSGQMPFPWVVGAAGSAALAKAAWREPRLGWRPLVQALADGARNSLPVAAACACAGIVIGVIALTGLGLQFTGLVLAVARDSLMPALVLTMVAGIVLGMGMPTTPAYIVQAALLIPALIKLGVLPIAAHLFVFYFAIISAITPPVAMAVYAAAGISGSNLWQTGLAAVRLGATGFVVPFMFVYGPSLLFIGDWFTVGTTVVSASVGVTALAAGLHGYLWRTLYVWERVMLVAGALLLIKPGLLTDLVGALLLAGVLAAQRLLPAPVAPGPVAGPERPAVVLEAEKIERAEHSL